MRIHVGKMPKIQAVSLQKDYVSVLIMLMVLCCFRRGVHRDAMLPKMDRRVQPYRNVRKIIRN